MGIFIGVPLRVPVGVPLRDPFRGSAFVRGVGLGSRVQAPCELRCCGA